MSEVVDLRAATLESAVLNSPQTIVGTQVPVTAAKTFFLKSRAGIALLVFVASFLILLVINPPFVQKPLSDDPKHILRKQSVSIVRVLIWSAVPGILAFVLAGR